MTSTEIIFIIELYLALMYFSLICQFLCGPSVVCQFTASSFSHSPSCITSSIGPFHGTTRKLHLCSMPLLIIAILHMPICVCRNYCRHATLFFLFMDLFNSFILVCGNNILYIMIGMRLP